MSDATATVLRPTVPLVATHLPGLRQQLRNLVEQGVRELVLDLSGVSMVDSTGIGMLIATHNSLSSKGGQLRIVAAAPDLLELFRAMRIDRHLPISG